MSYPGITLDQPQLLSRREDGAELAMALWRLGSPLLALSSAPYGGGWGVRHWVLAAQVAPAYNRAAPADHLGELARDLELDGPGIGLLTAADVRLARLSREDGVAVAATVGLTHPSWAAAADADAAALPVGAAGVAGAAGVSGAAGPALPVRAAALPPPRHTPPASRPP